MIFKKISEFICLICAKDLTKCLNPSTPEDCGLSSALFHSDIILDPILELKLVSENDRSHRCCIQFKRKNMFARFLKETYLSLIQSLLAIPRTARSTITSHQVEKESKENGTSALEARVRKHAAKHPAQRAAVPAAHSECTTTGLNIATRATSD